jgi:hypothetical protein
MLTKLLTGAAFAATLGFAGSAQALITITIDDEICNGCTNIHVLEDTGTNLVVGGTTAGETVDVIFTGIENIDSSGDGFGTVWVGASDGTTTNLDVGIEGGYTFSSFGFNTKEPAPPLDGNPGWGIKITAFYVGGSYSQSFSPYSQNTSFRVDSTDGGMTHVLMQLLDGQGNIVADENGFPYTYEQGNRTKNGVAYWEGFGQFKMDGVQSTTVPEPATWGLMIMGFGAAGAMLRRRRTALA